MHKSYTCELFSFCWNEKSTKADSDACVTFYADSLQSLYTWI